jgi:ribosome-associated toxin RatA of RatAB toxin-antitoxin module
MREVKRSALVNQLPARLYALINDVERYPQFLPWCTHARVESRTPQEIVATIGVRQGALQGEFTTRNTLEADRSVQMRLVSGPFRTLEGQWLLTPVEAGCRIDLTMRFAFRHALTGLLFEAKFAETVGSLVDAFVVRARGSP